MYKHTCKECKKEFENNVKTTSFCSVKCKSSFQHNQFLLNSKKLINKRFGKLLVLDVIIENGKTKCFCLCDCGNKTSVNSCNLKNGHTTSCGCYQKQKALSFNNIYLEKYRKENHREQTNLSRLNSPKSKNNKSGYKGVYFHRQKNKWVAKLNFQGKSYSKVFNNMDEAISYRKKLEEKYFKPILDKYQKNVDK